MKKVLLVTLFILTSTILTYATHIEGGDLTYKKVSTFTYELTFTLYRDTEGIAATTSGVFNFGDGSEEEPGADLQFIESIAGGFEIYEYKTTHTYGSAGKYTISYRERNRDAGITNFSSSIETMFYIESTILISNSIDENTSPVFLNHPIEYGSVGQKYVHFPGAYDEDGDSLSYRLTVPKQEKDTDVAGYTFPGNSLWAGPGEDGGNTTFKLDPITGELIWDTPSVCGEYALAFYVDEWRNGVLIGSVIRDMKIKIIDPESIRPKIGLLENISIVANQTLVTTIEATDEDENDEIRISLLSSNFTKEGLFGLEAPSQVATIDYNNNNTNQASATLNWLPGLNDISTKPYITAFKVVENKATPSHTHGGCATEGPLSDIKIWRVTVVGEAPQNFNIITDNENLVANLNWDQYPHEVAGTQMTIWRNVGSYDMDNSKIIGGLPEHSPYKKIGSVDISETSFTDNTIEEGLTYSYRIYVEFPLPNGGKSVASEEKLVYVESPIPVLTNVSIEKTHITFGEIALNWITPTGDNGYPEPHSFIVARSQGTLDNFVALQTENNALTNSSFTDTNLNTFDNTYYYKIILLSNGNIVDTSEVASTVRLSVETQYDGNINLSWAADVPWSNYKNDYTHLVYRSEINDVDNFELLAEINPFDGLSYTDDGSVLPIVENETYYYRVITKGALDNPGNTLSPLENYSQIALIENPLNIPEVTFESEGLINVFPNPFKNVINLEIDNPLKGKIQINLLNLTGQIIYHKEIDKSDQVLNTSFSLSKSLPKGMYILQVYQGNNLEIKRLVKQ